MIWTIPKNNVDTTLGASYTAGAGSLTVATGTGAMFGTVSPAMPMRFTVYSATDPTLFTIFKTTGRSGDVLSGLSVIEGTTDRNYAAGSKVRGYMTAGEITDLQAGVNACVQSAPDTAARNTIQPPSDFVPLTVKANASQTANLFEVRNSADAVTGSVNSTGRFFAAGVHGGYSEVAPDTKAILSNCWVPRDANLNNFCFFDQQDELAFIDKAGITTFFSPAPNSTTTSDGSGTNTVYRDDSGYCTWGASTSPYPITIEIDLTASPVLAKARGIYQVGLTFRADAFGVLPTSIKFESWNSTSGAYDTHYSAAPSYINTTSGQNAWLSPRFTSPGTSGNVYKLRFTLSGTNPLPAGQNFRLQRVILYHTTQNWDPWHLHVGGGSLYGALLIRPNSDTTKGLTVKANSATQSANLIETQNEAGVVKSSMSYGGAWTCQTLFVAAGTATFSSTGNLVTFRLSAQSSTTADQTQGKILSAWTVSTHATRAADVAFYASDFAADRELIRIRADGTTAKLGFFGVTPVARQSGGAITASATYGTNEQTMLQRAYDALRNLGLIT